MEEGVTAMHFEKGGSVFSNFSVITHIVPCVT